MITWSTDVNLGQLLTSLVVMGSVFMAYTKFAARLAQHELKIETMWNAYIHRDV